MTVTQRSPAGIGRLAAGVVVASLAAALLPGAPTVAAWPRQRGHLQAAAAVPDTITVTGHGWGHGRGMGQWGAYGYAVGPRWGWRQILDHFYGGSSEGNAGNPQITVALSQLLPGGAGGSGNAYPDTTVVLPAAAPVLVTPDNVSHPVLGHAVRLARSGPGAFHLWVAASCAGPWVDAGFLAGGTIRILPANGASEAVADTLGICEPSQAGLERHLLGEIRAVDTGSGQATVNALPVDSYIRSVVPREMPAGWAGAAGGAGMNALQAQAVAARSYGLGSSRYPYANTCDSSCQSYGGRWIVEGGNAVSGVDPRSDMAVASTSGEVRMQSGRIAVTEFSASSGGYTAGGAFTAVPDDGDAVNGNPNHSWTTTISRAAIEQRYGKGVLQSMDVTRRNGLGDLGGRVLSLNLVFSGGSVTLTGDDFRAAFGLKSNWFAFTNPCRDPSSASPPFPSITAMVDQQYADILDRPPDRGAAFWVGEVACGRFDGPTVVRLFLTSNEADSTLGQVVRLYVGVFGRFPDPGGAFFWQGRLQAGLTPAGLADGFVSSSEFQSAHGAQPNDSFVRSMYLQMLGRPADTGGLAYWTAALDSGALTRSGFVLSVMALPEFRNRWQLPSLVHETYLAMLRRTPDPGGYSFWLGRLEAGEPLQTLVAGFYGSAEYARRFS